MLTTTSPFRFARLMSSSPTPTSRPATLEAAVVRIHLLERRLALAEQALRSSTGQTLDQLLGLGQPTSLDAEPSFAGIPSSTPSATLSSASLSPADSSPKPRATEAIDIAPFILRALAIRKGIQHGTIAEEDREGEVMKLVEGTGLSEKQVDQVREWAGVN
jgi:hypothetical protein